MLLEVGIVTKHLPVILEPRGLHARYGVIFGSISSLHEGEVVDGLAHLVNQILIDIFLQELSFFLLRAILEVELLSLVIALLVWIVEDMTGKEGNFLGNVCLH